jgi:hypothetical protein
MARVQSKIRLYEIQAQLCRADKHLSELETEVAFARNFHGGGKVVKHYSNGRYEIADLFDEVLPDIRAIAGEFANALRSSLNYFVFQIAQVDSGKPPGRLVQFPIEDKPEIFDQHRTIYLEGVSDEHVALFKQLQPCYGCNWIKNLRDLSNIHKHQGLIVAMMVASGIRNNNSTQTFATGSNKMKMKFESMFEVTLEDGTPIIKTLEILQLCVTDVLDQFDMLIDQSITLDHG